jgi:hypothetical protein
MNEETKKGWKGTVRAMLTKHPDKFSKDGEDGKMNPWAIAHSMANKGAKSHYKDQESSLEGKPEKKEKYKNEGVMNFKEFMNAQPVQPTQQPGTPDMPQQPPQAMTQSIAAKTDQLLKMIDVKNPMQIQQIRDELNRRIQELQAGKGWGQRAANLSYRSAAQSRKGNW